jgi:manganese/zinc/iron transport system permease protein
VLGAVTLADLALLVLLWKELAATTFDPDFAAAQRLRPTLLTRLLVIAVAVTAVSAFEAVGAILVVTMLVVPAATAFVLTRRLPTMVAVSVLVGWIGAAGGQRLAFATDSSIAGAMGLVCAACFVAALLARQVPRWRTSADRSLQRLYDDGWLLWRIRWSREGE